MAETRRSRVIPTFIPLLLLFGGLALAQEEPGECVEMGGMAYDNWSKSDSGGSGMPAGEADNDYIRCKACHGWDRMGTEGGYVRRSRKDGRPNAGAGDSDTSSRVISPFMGGHDPITAEMISHAGTGRAFTDGTGSWVPLDATHSAVNKSAHAEGYTLGNQHPDLSADGANAGDTVLTAQQLACLVEFLNFEDADASAYFSDITTSVKPALYTIVDTADAAAGETFFGDNCAGCHGADPSQEAAPIALPDGGSILSYLDGDGKFSELAHKARWGIPDESMTRDAMSSPSSADIANLLLWLQQEGGTGFAANPGLSGTWGNLSTRDGEGFLVDFAFDGDGNLILFASFYTYDDMGNQVWLTAQSTAINGAEIEVVVIITDSAMWGAAFNPDDVVRTVWGSGTFSFSGCASGSFSLMPNDEMKAMGFTDLTYALNRILIPGIECPTPAG